MDDIFLEIKGILSDNARQKILRALRYSANEPFSQFLFFDYSFFDIPCGTIFSHFCEKGKQQLDYPFFCKIMMVTQQFGLLYNAVPKGHQTICHLILDEASYELLNFKIAKVDYWSRLTGNFSIAKNSCSNAEISV